MQTETSIHLQEIALERAMAQSRDEAEAWDKSPLARFAMMQCNALELASDELAGIDARDGEAGAKVETQWAIEAAREELRRVLEMMRYDAIDNATAGFDDDDFSESLTRDTPTVSEALAKMRKEQARVPILEPHHDNKGIWRSE